MIGFPLICNEGAKRSVENALKTAHIPHAVIIEGESGTGKTTLANYLAKAILCDTHNVCGVCRSCTLVSAGTHPDLYITKPSDGKKNISVDQIRKMRNEAYIRPQLSDSRVFIIDKAETMNAASQNAILKVLEEPPGNVHFILTVRSRFALLDTIVSRCVCLSLTNPDIDSAVKFLSSDSKSDIEKVKTAVNTVCGNIGRAQELLGRRKPKKTDNAVYAFAEAMMDGNEYGMLCALQPFEKDRVSTAEFFAELKYILLGKCRVSYKNSVLEKKLVLMYDVVKSMEEQLNLNVNLQLLFACLSGKLSQIVKGE